MPLKIALTGAPGFVGRHVASAVMAKSWKGDPILLEPDKHSNLIWDLPLEAPGPLLPYVQQALESIMRNVRYSEFGWDEQPVDG